MNILITNHHSKQNKGDLAIVLGLMAGLKAENINVKFNILGKDIGEEAWWKERGVGFFTPLLHTPKQNRWKAVSFFINYYVSTFLLSWPAIALKFYSPEKVKTLRAYKDTDLIISKGGSFFREAEYKHATLPIGIMGHLHQLIVATKFKKPIILSAQSFGPINNHYAKYIVSKVFKKCKLIITRDKESEIFLRQKLQIRENIFSAGDSAFLLEGLEGKLIPTSVIKSIEENKKKGYKCVGLTVRSWSNQDQFESYFNSIWSLIETYSKDGFYFYFMPQVVGISRHEDDRITSSKVWNNLSDSAKNIAMVIEDELEVGELLSLYKQMDYFVATRLHSAIFSLLVGTPVITIGYEPKTLAIFTDLNIKDYVLDIRSISSDKIQKSFEILRNTHREVFSKAKEMAVMTARKNIGLILETLKRFDIMNK